MSTPSGGSKARFQFSLRGLMTAVTKAAVVIWVAKFIGMGTALGLLLGFVALHAISKRPLAGGVAFVAVTVAALCSGLLYDGHYIQLHTVNYVLAEFPEIDKVWLCTNDDLTLEVEGLWFTTVDQPEAVFGIEQGTDGATRTQLRNELKRVLL